MTISHGTGLVLAAGGARGAYQAGALAELLPALAARAAAPTIVVGESVGALNAAMLAARANHTAQEQADALVAHWVSASKADVLRPLWRQLPALALRYAGEALGLPGVALRGLLDVAPLRTRMQRDVDWEQLHANVAAGTIAVLGVTATTLATGRSVTFVEQSQQTSPAHDGEISYHPTRLDVDHVVASAAIPVLFPPVWVNAPAAAAAWYLDGSTRLHTPLRPALDLGAERVVIVATTSLYRRRERKINTSTVDIGDTAVVLLHAMVEDSVRRDLARLVEINRHLAGDGTEYAAVRRLREAQGRSPYRRVPFIAIAPDDPYEIADLALDVFHARYHGWRGMRDPDVAAMHRLLGGDSPLQGEVLSFLLFDEVFHGELVRLGRRDARRWLTTHDGARFVPHLDAVDGR